MLKRIPNIGHICVFLALKVTMTSTKLYENSNFNEPSRSFKNLLMPSGIEFLNIIKKVAFL